MNGVILSSHLVVDSTIWYILGGIVALYLLYLIRFKIAYKMAKNRHRDQLGWVLLSIFISPLWTWIILALIGEEKK